MNDDVTSLSQCDVVFGFAAAALVDVDEASLRNIVGDIDRELFF